MKILLRCTSLLAVLVFPLFVAACQSGGSTEIGFGSAQPRLATWRCTGGVTLTVRNVGSMLSVTDSRGFDVDLPPEPPGQRERYAKTGYAMVFAGRTLSWFASKQQPMDCRR